MNGRGVTLGSGMGKGLFSIVLPRSKYYDEAADWVVPDTGIENGIAADSSLQVCLRGSLWAVTETAIYERSLATGEVTEHPNDAIGKLIHLDSTAVHATKKAGIVTDGDARFWFVSIEKRIIADDETLKIYINEYNVATKQMISTAGYSTTNTSGSTKYLTALGVPCYSKKLNRVYVFGEHNTARSTSKTFYLDLEDHTARLLETECPIVGFNNGYAYEAEDGYIYLGGGFIHSAYTSSDTPDAADLNKTIYKYWPADDVYEVVTDTFRGLEIFDQYGTFIQVGENMFQLSQTGTFVFNPMTGEQVGGTTPLAVGSVVTYGMCAYADNMLYVWVDETALKVKMCSLYTEPEDAPIVAKIYKGQKFHTIIPFKIYRGKDEDGNPIALEVTTRQQKAEEDIEIRMYNYASEGGQILYIET